MVRTGVLAKVPPFALALCSLVAGCEGSLDAPVSPLGPQGVRERGVQSAPGSGDFAVGRFDPGQCKDRELAPGPMPGVVRLTHRQYDNAVRDVLGIEADAAKDFVADQQVDGFDNNAKNLAVPENQVLRYQTTAERVALAASQDLTGIKAIVPCAAPGADNACRDRFLSEVLKRLLRRPLTSAERTRYRALFQAGNDLYSEGDAFTRGVRIVLEAVLQTPSFLYRSELRDVPLDGRVVALSSHEVAARLALTLWASVPDSALMKKADAKQLESAAQVEAEARRMLADPKAARVLDDFHAQWLELNKLRFEKDSALYPGYDKETFEASAKQEMLTFTRKIATDGRIAELFDAPTSYVNKQLASIYGVSTSGDEVMQQVQLDPAQRAGVLTQIGFLAGHADSRDGSPIHRGAFIQKRVLCASFGQPPPNVGALPARTADIVTTRDQVEVKTQPQACMTCHAKINPAGFAFETFDGIGKYRTHDHGAPVDASGVMKLDGVEQGFDGPVEFSQLLAESDTVRRCYETQWFRYALGRSELDDDVCLLHEIDTRVEKKGSSIEELLVGLTVSRGFRFRAQEEL